MVVFPSALISRERVGLCAIGIGDTRVSLDARCALGIGDASVLLDASGGAVPFGAAGSLSRLTSDKWDELA